MTMKTDELSKPLLTPNGAALKRELARAINYIESVSESLGRPADQAAELDAVLSEVRAYMTKTHLLVKATK